MAEPDETPVPLMTSVDVGTHTLFASPQPTTSVDAVAVGDLPPVDAASLYAADPATLREEDIHLLSLLYLCYELSVTRDRGTIQVNLGTTHGESVALSWIAQALQRNWLQATPCTHYTLTAEGRKAASHAHAILEQRKPNR